MLDNNYLLHRQHALSHAKSIAEEYVRTSQIEVVSESELARLVSLSAIVFACIQFRAENASQVKFVAYDGDVQLDEWHPAQRAVSNLSEWLMQTENALCIYGDTLSKIELNRFRMPLKLNFINNMLWSVRTYRQGGGVNYYISAYSGNYDTEDLETTTLTPKEVVYFRNAIDPYTDYAGISPLEAAYLSAATGIEMSQTQLFSFLNRAIPAMMVQPAIEQPQNQQFNFREAAKNLVEAFRRLITGSRYTGKTFVASERWEVQMLQSNFKDLDMTGLRSDEIRQVLTAFRVYESLILAGSSNYATAVQEATNWADSWLKPRMYRLGEAIATQLKPYCMDVQNLRIVPDENTIPFLENKRSEQIETLERMAKSAAIDLYTYQEQLGQEPQPQFKGLYYYEGKGWIDVARWQDVWTYGLLIAPSTRNAGIIPDDVIPFDPGSTETALNELETQAEVAQTEAEAQVAEAEAQAVEEGGATDTGKSAWTDDAIARAQKELKQYSKFIQSKGIKSIADFEFEYLPQNIVNRVTDRLTKETNTPYGDIFAEAREWVVDTSKSISSTRLDFENGFDDTLIAARSGRLEQRRFTGAIQNMIEVYMRRAAVDGLVAGGVTDGAMTDEEETALNSLIRSKKSLVPAFSRRVYAGISDEEAALKPAQWYAGTLSIAYSFGLTSAGDNGMYEFTGYDGNESCPDCKRLKGQRHRLSVWERNGLNLAGGSFVGQNTKCKGYKCEHKLIKIIGRARGRLKSEDMEHFHSHEGV